MRRPVKKRNIPKPDIKFGSERLEKFINYVMIGGKKETSRKIVYGALDIIKEKMSVEEPTEIFESAIRNVGPAIEVRSRRWIIDAARAGKGKPMHERLAAELMAAHNNEGVAIKKRDDTKKMAESNKAFAHLAW